MNLIKISNNIIFKSTTVEINNIIFYIQSKCPEQAYCGICVFRGTCRALIKLTLKNEIN